MKKTLPLGSVIKVHDMQAAVAGYEWLDNEGRTVFAYRVVPFPLGYTTPRSLKLVPAEDVELLSLGYQDSFSEHYCALLDMVCKIGTHCSASELAVYLQDAEKILAAEFKKEDV